MFMLANRKFKYFILRHLRKPFTLISTFKKIVRYHICTYTCLSEDEYTGFKHVEDKTQFNVLV